MKVGDYWDETNTATTLRALGLHKEAKEYEVAEDLYKAGHFKAQSAQYMMEMQDMIYARRDEDMPEGELMDKKITYEVIARYRDGGSQDIERIVYFLQDGEWVARNRRVIMINAPMGRITSIMQNGAAVDRDLEMEMRRYYELRADGVHCVTMKANPGFDA